ncbi:small, acid-soluble spore protein I [Paenibacillus baekrokdamisoli]|uniref:Small, acid-soluble spore protein I n=1 Tax=Paenibacillus baekrokdamisoli TaxID=1712516 RepID=A0A3G9J0K8_9BACL|nr:small acid-soluble spore protein SspI [Paenibacillus baekrokdamisoli]MBB3072143.1 small acid-soluble spore protein I (minor) [Paenibacillus baekrokdamisoli]BBH24727.1 small, acid-soluble spore protein I [Paenibacillus baekrokdamisoli]
MSNLDLRQAIVRRVQDKTGEELTDVIESSIGQDERALPGLGVLFEMIWKNSAEPEHSRMVETLYNHLHLTQTAPPSPS